jgi:hypothetical protein
MQGSTDWNDVRVVSVPIAVPAFAFATHRLKPVACFGGELRADQIPLASLHALPQKHLLCGWRSRLKSFLDVSQLPAG